MLFALATVGLVLSAPDTEEPVVSCGTSALRLLVQPEASAPDGRQEDCDQAAEDQVGGALLLFGMPAALLLVAPHVLTRTAQAERREVEQGRRTGVWRHGALTRAFAAGAGWFDGLIGASLLAFRPLTDFAMWAAFFAPLIVLCYRGAIYPRILAGTSEVEIVNPILRHRVPWRDVAAVTPGWSGAEIVRRDGRVITASVGQKSNWATWRGKHTHGHDVAEYLADRASRLSRDTTDDLVRDSGLDRPTSARRNVLIALAIVVGALLVRLIVNP